VASLMPGDDSMSGWRSVSEVVSHTVWSVMGVSLILLTVDAPQGHSQSNVIAEFQGNGSINTKPFEAPGPWEIQWTGDAPVGITVYDRNNNFIDSFGGRNETSYVNKPGSFYLSIFGVGTWTVTVRSVR
jgi:hypothetical protein